MITVQFYNSDKKSDWDDFINQSKNGTFMLKRDFMEYHSDRFKDFSLMIFEDDLLIAVLPASLHGEEVRSHGGLTYGGLVYNLKMTAQKMLDVFDCLEDFLKQQNIKNLIYKRIPTVYHQYPSDEDVYALFRKNARLIRKDISTSIYLPAKMKFSDLRTRGVKKAVKNGLVVKECDDFDTYINLLNDVLQKHHNANSVHTAQELKRLRNYFPDNIKLFSSFKESEMLAGVLIFENKQTVHAQYIANSEEGRKIGALDLVMDYLINTYSVSKTYFDFGISTENNGLYLNNGLVGQKEMFGGRAISYDFYDWIIQ